MSQEKNAVVIVGARPPVETLIREAVEDLVDVTGAEADPRRIKQIVQEKAPQIAVMFLDDQPAAVLTAAQWATAHGGIMVIVASMSKDHSNILESMRAGARDFAFIDESDPADLRRAVGAVGSLRAEIEAAGDGRIVAVFSAKGGSGATTIASNLAGALMCEDCTGSPEPRRVVLLDFDLEMGDVQAFLDLELRYSYHDLLVNMHRLDADLLNKAVTQHSSGLHVLANPDQIDQAEDVSAEQMKQILMFLKKHFDYIVIDGLRDFRELSIVGLDTADYIVLTATPDIPALKNANRCLRLFARLGYETDMVKLVINRFEKSKDLNQDSIADALGRRIDATVCNHFPSVISSINQGKLLVEHNPSSKVSRDIKDLAPLFAPETAETKRRGFLSFWRGK